MSRAGFRNHEDVRAHNDRGQATVEFALILPLLIGILVLIVQVTMIAVTQLEVVDETRRAARLASLAEDPRAAASGSLPDGSTSTVTVVFDETSVTVTVSRTVNTDVPIIGRLIPSVDVQSRLVMPREPRSP